MTSLVEDPELVKSIQRGDLAGAASRLLAGADPNARWPESELGERLLHLAAWMRSVPMIELLVEHGVHVDGCSVGSDTPLLAAIRWWSQRGDLEVVRALLHAGADPNARRRKIDAPPLHLAVWQDDVALVDALLVAGADPNAHSERRKTTALHLARSSSVMQRLLEGGADPRVPDSKSIPLFGVLAAPGRFRGEAERLACVELLVEHGSPVDSPGRTCSLTLAASNRELSIVDYLLRAGADPNCRDASGGTPIGAALWEDTAILRRLLEAGADARVPAVLHAAVQTGYLEVVERLLAAGADPNAANELGQRAVDIANDPAIREHLARVTTAPSQGGRRKPRSRSTKAALHTAAEEGDLAALEARLAAGDDPNGATGKDGTLPLHVAKTPEVIARLVAAGADPSGCDAGGQTPLHAAIALADHLPREELLARVDALLGAGAPIDAREQNGFSALELAIDSGIPELVARLLDAHADMAAASSEEPSAAARAATAAFDSRRLEILKLLIAKGGDVRGRYAGRTVLHDLAMAGPLEAIAIVRAAGASIDARDDSGRRPHEWATDPVLRDALK